MISFEGQAVVVTGAGGGLGQVIAKEIARRGGMVLANDLGGPITGGDSGASPTYADSLVAAIREAGGTAVANYDSVTTPEGGKRIIEAALDHFGRIDALVLNAGTMRYGAFETLGLDDLNALLGVHVGGAWNVAQAAWPHLRRQAYGRVVFACSSAGTLGNAALSAYGAAKGAVMGLMHGLSEAGAPHGILCNAYMPNAMSRMTETIQAEELGGNPWSLPLGQYFAPDYTTGLVTYLASRACTTQHGIYSALGGRVGRLFLGVADGIAQDAPFDADTIAANWGRINDDRAGYAIPANNTDEFRIVAQQRGIDTPVEA